MSLVGDEDKYLKSPQICAVIIARSASVESIDVRLRLVGEISINLLRLSLLHYYDGSTITFGELLDQRRYLP